MERTKYLVTDKKNGKKLFDRPKPTVGCSANGIIIIIRRRRNVTKDQLNIHKIRD
jgi:hypothetical protein